MNISGVLVQYYKSCKTELWYFSHKISYNDYDENIKVGRLIHEDSFKNDKKNIQLDGTISLDLIKHENELKIMEVKKSSKLIEPAKYQLLYYLWYIKRKTGKSGYGTLNYPKERKTVKVELTPEKEKEIEDILEKVKEIVNLPKPPEPVKKPYCKKCSYYELCWIT